jgi:hypothetical protein
MALTLVEAAKLHSGDAVRSAVIELYARSSDILMALPFETVNGNALRYSREEKLPGVGFRGVNEAYPESTGVLNPVTEPLVIAGGDIDVDKFIVETMGANQRAVQEHMKVKSLALKWTQAFLKGDSESDPRSFDGLEVRLTGDQILDAGSTSGGDALSLARLDELIDQVDDPTHLVMNKAMRRLLTAAARDNTIGGYLSWEADAFGRQLAKYNDLPILIADKDNEGNEILPFEESNPGGGTAASTSIYCVSFAEGMLSGIQNGDIEVRDMGELQTKPVMRTRVEWYSGLAVFHGKSAARLQGVKKAAVTA